MGHRIVVKTIYLHIGTHKTGSTAIQKWLFAHKRLLKRHGYGVYRGRHNRKNHVELYLGAMRYDRDSFRKQAMPKVTFDERYTAAVARRVQRFVARTLREQLILTTEGLSLLRHADEVERLAQILGGGYDAIRIVLFLRNRDDYLNSYRAQLQKKKGRQPATDYGSALYVEDDTWLTDYDGLIDVYAGVFGRDNLVVIDYDREMERRGNVIPSFLETIGFPVDEADPASFEHHRHNVTTP